MEEQTSLTTINSTISTTIKQSGELPITLDQAIITWINAKAGRTNSANTRRRYESVMQSFRETLRQFGLDLTSDSSIIAIAALGWAARRYGSDGKDVSNATFNNRLAIISSFYEFCRKRRLAGIVENPMELNDKKPVQAYAQAHALSDTEAKRRMRAISRTSRAGKRDYALLSIALSTGRRASELAGMRWGHIHLEGQKINVTFPQCKGGKVMHDELGAKVSEALLGYLHMVYGAELGILPHDAPIWISFSRNDSKGGAITTQAIADICEKHLGTSKVHTTRHTFAVGMEKAGARLSEISHRLGHENEKTTGDYLEQLHSSENQYTPALETFFGLEGEE